MTTAAPQLIIYHLEGRRSERIVWFAEEVGLPYELVFVPGDLMASMEKIRAASPLLPVAPTVRYNGEVLVESAAVLQLLQERHAPASLAPARDSASYPKYLQWLHFAESSAAARCITEWLLRSVKGGELPPIAARQLNKTDQVLAFLEDHLRQHAYFGGEEFSIADIMMQFNVQFLQLVAGKDLAPYPQLVQWQQRVEARPAFKRMREVALPNGHIGLPR